jgi:hypothetical protein
VFATGRALQIEDHRLLVAVVVPEEQRAFETGLVFEERPDSSCSIALGRLDLHYLGAEPSQQQPGIFGALVGDLDHPQAGQHPRSSITHHFAWSERDCADLRLRHGASSSQEFAGARPAALWSNGLAEDDE